VAKRFKSCVGAAETEPVPALVAGEDSNASSSSLPSKSNRKRELSNRGTPDKLDNESKRSKSSDKGWSFSLRNRSKSLHFPNPRVLLPAPRARSVCAASLHIEPDKSTASVTAASELKTPARSSAAHKLPATDKFYLLPFKYGWKRELVLRSSASVSRQRGDVIFISPGGKKLRSREDILPLL
ncbi:hypothetical protein AWZ03_015425, partial [Drosophila navojoa]